MSDIVSKTCKICGRKYFAPKGRSRKTCSFKCELKSKIHIGEKHFRWGGTKKCMICDKEILGREKRKNKTCSSECSSKLRSASRSGNKNPRWLGGTVNCKQCGKEIFHAHRLHVLFCSRDCAAKWQSQNLSKENSPLWKGGSAYGEYPPEFNAKLRSEIRKRDEHKCRLCGIKKYDLDVHHIDEDKSNSSPGNLISLCRSCHRKVHWNPNLL